MTGVSVATVPATKLEQNAFAQGVGTSDVTGRLFGNVTGESTKWIPADFTVVEGLKTTEPERTRAAYFTRTRREASEPSIERLEKEAESIMRTHFAVQILSDLKQVQHYCRSPRAAMYAESLFSTMRLMREVSPYDPYLGLVMALYDALAYRNSWADYNGDQYQVAYKILKQVANVKSLNRDRIEKGIMKLEAAGFDTTPFAVDVADGDDDQSDGQE